MLGHDYPISYRFSADEFVDGGLTLRESLPAARILERAGVHALNVSAGIYESLWAVVDTADHDEGWKVYLAEAIKRAVSVPVITVGTIRSPHTAERIIAEGRADFVVVGRGLIADPEWVSKALAGEEKRIRPCISCNQGCLEGHGIFAARRMRCSVNPAVGHEARYVELPHAERRKRVIVVGGGPAGMEAAKTAARRGHHVTLFEKRRELGGQLLLASVPPGKDKISRYREWLAREVEEAGVDIRTGVEATAVDLKRTSADAIFLATGATASVPDVPGGEYAVSSWDVLSGEVRLDGDSVVVVGGASTGIEAALFLASNGKKVRVVRRGRGVAPDLGPANRFHKRLLKAGCVLAEEFETLEIGPGWLRGRDAQGSELVIRADAVVWARGRSPESKLATALSDRPGVRLVGDCVAPGFIIDAVSQGFRAALEI